MSRDTIQESREACGGHGYLKASRLGDLRDINDPSVTYEGDNNVLGQQTSNWLLRQWGNLQKTGETTSPLGTCSFLKNFRAILNTKIVVRNLEEITNFNCKSNFYSKISKEIGFITYQQFLIFIINYFMKSF